jgi:hypothetical protein
VGPRNKTQSYVDLLRRPATIAVVCRVRSQVDHWPINHAKPGSTGRLKAHMNRRCRFTAYLWPLCIVSASACGGDDPTPVNGFTSGSRIGLAQARADDIVVSEPLYDELKSTCELTSLVGGTTRCLPSGGARIVFTNAA